MSGFDVEPAELQAAEVVLDDAVRSGRADLARLRTSADDLLGGGWRGGAATAFGAGWHDWLDGADSVLAALEELGVALGTAGRDYQHADSSVQVQAERAAS